MTTGGVASLIVCAFAAGIEARYLLPISEDMTLYSICKAEKYRAYGVNTFLYLLPVMISFLDRTC